MLLWIIIIILSVVIDQITKVAIANSFILGETRPVIDGFINFHYVRNKGAAWGMFSDARWVFITITLIMLIVLPYLLYRYRKLHFMFGLSLSLIIGGAIGNMIDRVFAGSVVDFIETAFMDFPVFNVADICVTIGAALMFIYLLFLDKTLFADKKKESVKIGETNNDDNSQGA